MWHRMMNKESKEINITNHWVLPRYQINPFVWVWVIWLATAAPFLKHSLQALITNCYNHTHTKKLFKPQVLFSREEEGGEGQCFHSLPRLAYDRGPWKPLQQNTIIIINRLKWTLSELFQSHDWEAAYLDTNYFSALVEALSCLTLPTS